MRVIPFSFLSNKIVTTSPSFTYTSTLYDSVTAVSLLSSINNFNQYTSDSQLCTFSSWFYINSLDDGTNFTFMSINPGSQAGSCDALSIERTNSNGLQIYAGQGQTNSWIKNTGFSGGSWFHLLVAIDLSSSVINVYKDGTLLTRDTGNVSSTTAMSFSNNNASQFEIGYNTYGCSGQDSSRLSYSELFFIAGYKASDTSNFRSSGNHPISLGSNGSTPFGSTPQVYIKSAAVNSGNTNISFGGSGLTTPSSAGVP